MNRDRPGPGVPVPTLTEVIEPGAPAVPSGVLQQAAVLAQVETQVAALFEQRLREALAASLHPAMDRAFEQTLAEARAALREWVADAVAQEMHRLRDA